MFAVFDVYKAAMSNGPSRMAKLLTNCCEPYQATQEVAGWGLRWSIIMIEVIILIEVVRKALLMGTCF